MFHWLFCTIEGNNGEFTILRKVFLDDKIIDTLRLCLYRCNKHENENQNSNDMLHLRLKYLLYNIKKIIRNLLFVIRNPCSLCFFLFHFCFFFLTFV